MNLSIFGEFSNEGKQFEANHRGLFLLMNIEYDVMCSSIKLVGNIKNLQGITKLFEKDFVDPLSDICVKIEIHLDMLNNKIPK